MSKKYLFLDSNIYLSLYRYSVDSLEKLEKLIPLLEAEMIELIVPKQVIDEFERNREKEIFNAIKQFSESTPPKSTPNVCYGYEETKDIKKAIAIFDQQRKNLLDKIVDDAKSRSLKADQVIDKIFAIAKKYIPDPQLIAQAKLRFQLGNPPGKNNSYGDAINWLTLLQYIPITKDIYFISADGDFTSQLDENIFSLYLENEWKRRKGSQVFFYKTLNSFIEKNYPDIKITDEDIKQSKIQAFIDSSSFDEARERLAYILKMSDINSNQLNQIVKGALENSQIYNAHSYSPEKIGGRLSILIERREQEIDYEMYKKLCEKFDIDQVRRIEDLPF
jgi:hypothetical protein